MSSFDIIVTMEENSRGIGFDQKLPWKIEQDWKYFRQITLLRKKDSIMNNPLKKNAVIMGLITWKSIGERILADRINVVVTKSLKYSNNQNLNICSSLVEALDFLKQNEIVDKIFVIGGEKLYEEALKMKELSNIYITIIKMKDCKYDKYFPEISNDDFILKKESNWIHLKDTLIKFQNFKRRVSEEYKYLDLISKILKYGKERIDRTGTGTIAIFGHTMRFDISKNFPLLTTKKMFWRGIIEELLWFISGSTDSKVLENKKVMIWKKNSSRDFLDKLGNACEIKGNTDLAKIFYNRREGDCGPHYGFNFRHFGAKYTNCDDDYSGKGFDQINWLIKEIKTNPYSRRLLLTAYDPASVEATVLPPCHILCQFFVSNDQKLSCHLYQRSVDVGLGMPFNIAQYSLLTYMIAHICELNVGEFIYSLGDAHIYKNHLEAMEIQIKRKPFPFPQIGFTRNVKEMNDWKITDIEIKNYISHDTLQMEMSE